MGSRLVVTWECERCHATTEGYEPMFQPLHWWTLRLTGPPRAVPDEAYTDRATLCPDCRQALKGWLAAGALVGDADVARATQEAVEATAHHYDHGQVLCYCGERVPINVALIATDAVEAAVPILANAWLRRDITDTPHSP